MRVLKLMWRLPYLMVANFALLPADVWRSVRALGGWSAYFREAFPAPRRPSP